MGLLRFIACVVIFVGSLILLIGGNRDGGDLLLFPMTGILPAALFTGVVLNPIEKFALARGKGPYLVLALPLTGATLPFVTMIVLALYWGEPSAFVRMVHLGPIAALPASMGFAWGFLWWITGVFARLAFSSDNEVSRR